MVFTRNQCGNRKKAARQLRDAAFSTVSPDGEAVDRMWLLYSPSTGKVFCFVCKLLTWNTSHSQLANNGFDSWTHINRLREHERSSDHRQALFAYISRRDQVNTLDTAVAEEFDRERTYWHEVLKKVVSTVKFLTSRGLALRGKTEQFGSAENGNFLGCLELLSEYDPFLAAHVQRYGNAGSGVTSYMSSTTYEEFVELMAER